MKASEAGPLIRRRIKKALKRGERLARETYGIEVKENGELYADGPMCGLGACLIGHKVKPGMYRYNDSEDYKAVVQEVLGINETQHTQFIHGFDEGDRATVWSRLGDDIATEFLGPPKRRR